MATLRIQTLGPFRIWRRGELIADSAWPTAKSKTLFKILLTERGRFVPADRLLEYLWPDLSPRRALNNLWVTVSHVRRTLEPELAPRSPSAYIDTVHDGYTFNQASDYWLDVDTFSAQLRAAQTIPDLQRRIEALEAARALYQGLYLDEDPYEEWALHTRASLHGEYLSLLADLADGYGRQGHYQHAIAICREILVHERSREIVYRQLMLYHYCAGDQSQALKVFEDCRRALDEELGVAPMPETTELYHKIQRREVETVDRTVQYPAPAPRIATSYSLSRVPFVGRQREYAHLLGLVAEAAAGLGHVVLVEGEAGIGKSRLVQETLGHARQHGLTTLVTNCYQIEQTMPYQPIVDLATQMLDDRPAESLAQGAPGLSPMSLAEIATLVPDVADHFPRLPSPTMDFPEARQARLFKALVQMIDAITAEGDPILLAVDDIHWSDAATLQFLHHLGRHVGDRPVLLICTFRGEAVAEDVRLSTFVYGIKRDPSTRHIELRRLSATDTQTLLARLADPALYTPELSAWLHRETDGNPFFLVSMLQSLLEQGLLAATGERAWQVQPTALLVPTAAARTAIRWTPAGTTCRPGPKSCGPACRG